jgi:hypothetical protein
MLLPLLCRWLQAALWGKKEGALIEAHCTSAVESAPSLPGRDSRTVPLPLGFMKARPTDLVLT